MVDIITVANRRQFASQMASMFEDRKRVFVDRLRWDLAVIGDRFEIDRFDDAAATYLLLADPEHGHLGSLRLLRTDRPHILGELFPHLCAHGVPTGCGTREITRLCLNPTLPAAERLTIRKRLISAMVDFALASEITTLTGVVSQRFLAKVEIMGWRCTRLGVPGWAGGTAIGAFRIEIDAATPRHLAETGIYHPPPSELSPRQTPTITGETP